MEVKFSAYPFFGPPLLHTVVNKDLVELLLNKGLESRKRNLDNTSRLVGEIDHEYFYEDFDEWFSPKFKIYMTSYLEAVEERANNSFDWLKHEARKYNIPIEDSRIKWTLDDLWINFQKQFEYNPRHGHTADFSFVIYVRIPKEIWEENKLHNHKRIENLKLPLDEREHGYPNHQGPGTITFSYGEHLPFNIMNITRIPSVGEMFIFPSWLYHTVAPFKSDVERISVSGNISVSITGK